MAPVFLGLILTVTPCSSVIVQIFANNCSFNGWCSVEYPVSRCVCNPGYFGEDCSMIECLNNCRCDASLGVQLECARRAVYSIRR